MKKASLMLAALLLSLLLSLGLAACGEKQAELGFTVTKIGEEKYDLTATVTGALAENVEVVETAAYDVVDVYLYVRSDTNTEITPQNFRLTNAASPVNPDYVYTSGEISLSFDYNYDEIDFERLPFQTDDANVVEFGLSESNLSENYVSSTFSYDTSLYEDANYYISARRYTLLFKQTPQNAVAGTASVSFVVAPGTASESSFSIPARNSDEGNLDEMVSGQYDSQYRITGNFYGFVYARVEASNPVPVSRYRVEYEVRSVTYGERGEHTQEKTVAVPTITVTSLLNALGYEKFTLKSGDVELAAQGICHGTTADRSRASLGDYWMYYRVSEYNGVVLDLRDASSRLSGTQETEVGLYFGDEIPETYTLYYDGTELKVSA